METIIIINAGKNQNNLNEISIVTCTSAFHFFLSMFESHL